MTHLLLISAVLCSATPGARTADHVTVDIVAKKLDDKLAITISLDIEKGYYIYGNPVIHPDLKFSQTQVQFMSEGKPVDADISYPPGTVVSDDIVGAYRIYTGKVAIDAIVEWPAADMAIAIRMHGIARTHTH